MKLNIIEVTVEHPGYTFTAEINKNAATNQQLDFSTMAKALSAFLQQGCIELDIELLIIKLNGFCSSRQKIADLNSICQMLHESLSDFTDLQFIIETNRYEISKDWIALFSQYQMIVAMNINHWLEENNAHAPCYIKSTDKTYGMKLLLKSAKEKLIPEPHAYYTINLSHSAKEVYQLLIHDLGFVNIDFVLPHLSYLDKQHHFFAKPYGEFLVEAFHIWSTEDNPHIKIRILNDTLSKILAGRPYLFYADDPAVDYREITISSSGKILPGNSLQNINANFLDKPYSIFTHSMQAFFKSNIMQSLDKASHTLPDDCKNCMWQKICAGGSLINRYAPFNHFNNASLMCDGLQYLYNEVAAYLIKSGISLDQLRSTVISN